MPLLSVWYLIKVKFLVSCSQSIYISTGVCVWKTNIYCSTVLTCILFVVQRFAQSMDEVEAQARMLYTKLLCTCIRSDIHQTPRCLGLTVELLTRFVLAMYIIRTGSNKIMNSMHANACMLPMSSIGSKLCVVPWGLLHVHVHVSIVAESSLCRQHVLLAEYAPKVPSL